MDQTIRLDRNADFQRAAANETGFANGAFIVKITEIQTVLVFVDPQIAEAVSAEIVADFAHKTLV